MPLYSSVIHLSMLIPFLAAVIATSGCSHDNPANKGVATSTDPVSPVAEGPASAIATATATAAPITTVAPAVEDRIVVLGRAATSEFYEGTDESLWNRLTPDMRKAIGTANDLNALRKQIANEYGREVNVDRERTSTRGGSHYERTSRFADGRRLSIAIAFVDEDRIAGLLVSPVREAIPSTHEDYKTLAPLRLPFDGEWFVFWGGRTIDENYHVIAKDQRFAYDIVKVKDGKTHGGAGTENTDYYAFGQDILAPADGVIVERKDGVVDNVPGEMNPAEAAGNHVMIDHGRGEYSRLAHFKNGTLTVRVGDTVKSGARLGACGNSGNSSEPHLHYHVQNASTFGTGEGLPAQFRGYTANGVFVDVGEPVKDQLIQNGTVQNGMRQNGVRFTR